jgi:hypothetical protein
MNEFSEQYLNGCGFGFRVDLLKGDQINNELEVWRDSSFGGAAVFFFFSEDESRLRIYLWTFYAVRAVNKILGFLEFL